MSIIEEYNALLIGDLLMLFIPKKQRVWETDKDKFTLIYQANQEMLKGYDNKLVKRTSGLKVHK
jgi:hypothetical protein